MNHKNDEIEEEFELDGVTWDDNDVFMAPIVPKK